VHIATSGSERSSQFSEASEKSVSPRAGEIPLVLFSKTFTYTAISRKTERLWVDSQSGRTAITWDDDRWPGRAILNATGAVEPSYWRVEGELLQKAMSGVFEVSGTSWMSAEESTGKAYRELTALSDERLLRQVLGFRKEELAKEGDSASVAKLALTAAFRKFSPKHLNNMVYRYPAGRGAIYVMPLEPSNGRHQIDLVQMDENGAAIATFVVISKRALSEAEVVESFLGLRIQASPH
jgi:hypothetical protein